MTSRNCEHNLAHSLTRIVWHGPIIQMVSQLCLWSSYSVVVGSATFRASHVLLFTCSAVMPRLSHNRFAVLPLLCHLISRCQRHAWFRHVMVFVELSSPCSNDYFVLAEKKMNWPNADTDDDDKVL